MCTKHGLSHSSIANKAKREDWQRDLAPIIKRDVARQLIELAATSNASIKGVTDDLVAVKHGAAMIVSVIQRHRSDITDLAELCRTQLAELRTVTVATDKLLRGVARLKDLDSIDEEQAKTLIGDLRKLATLPSRVGALTAVSSNFDRLQTMERRAFGVKDDVDPVEPEGSKKPRNILIEFVEAPYRELELASQGQLCHGRGST